MSERIENIEKRLVTTREKIRESRREITGGVTEDRLREIGKKTYEVLDKEFEQLQEAIKEQRVKAKERRAKIFDEVEESVSAAHTKLRTSRRNITGGVVEDATLDAGRTIKEKGGAVLQELEDELSKLSERLKRAKEED